MLQHLFLLEDSESLLPYRRYLVLLAVKKSIALEKNRFLALY